MSKGNVYLCLHLYVFVCMCVCVGILKCVCGSFVSVCVCVSVSVCKFVCVSLCVCVCVCKYMCVRAQLGRQREVVLAFPDCYHHRMRQAVFTQAFIKSFFPPPSLFLSSSLHLSRSLSL